LAIPTKIKCAEPDLYAGVPYHPSSILLVMFDISVFVFSALLLVLWNLVLAVLILILSTFELCTHSIKGALEIPTDSTTAVPQKEMG